MVSYQSVCVYWQWPNALQRFQIWLALTSGFIMEITTGTLFTFGNMVPYLVSYIRQFSQPASLRYIHSPIIAACQVIGLAVSMPLGGYLERKFGPRLVTLAGGWFMSLGILLTYFTINISFWMTVLTYGVMYGLGRGMAFIGPIICSMKWLPKWEGTASGIVLLGYGLSPFLFNYIQTMYINPHNLTPNEAPFLDKPTEKYFTQKELLLRVPSAFLVFGGVCGVLQLVASVFLVDPPPLGSQGISCRCSETDEDPSPTSDLNNIPFRELINNGTGDVGSRGDDVKLNSMGSHAESDKPIADGNGQSKDMNPLQMLTTVKFYLLWSISFFVLTANNVMFSLYKAYSFEEVTDDDHFLSSVVGSVMGISNMMDGLVWGLVADFLGYSFAFVLQSSLNSIALLTFYTTSVGGKIMFLIWVGAYFLNIGASIHTKATMKIYGKTHAGVNLSIVFSGQILASVVAALIPYFFLDYVHWYGLFFILGGISLVQLFFSILLTFV